jgi:hypothetical protein
MSYTETNTSQSLHTSPPQYKPELQLRCTMRFKILGKSKESTQLNDDVLRLILDELCLGDQETLLSICSVSRRFYILTVPYLYRNVRLDFARQSHLHLVRRLIKPKLPFAARIRTLSITGTDKMTTLRLLDLYILFARITKLQQLEWRGCLSIPHLILETLSLRFPAARVSVEASNMKLGVSANAPLPLYTILNHMASRQLTHFEFIPANVDQLYVGIKADLMGMLMQTKTLQHFRWLENFSETQQRPQMLDCFWYGSLPPLASFYLLSSTLFTINELRLWGRTGGWSELTRLTLYDSKQLCAFIGQIPKLQELSFFPVENFAIERLAVCLAALSHNAPFGCVSIFSYNDQNHRYRFAKVSVVVPWCMLEKMPKLEDLTLNRCRFIWEYPQPTQDMVTLEDVRLIRTMFPHLRSLSIDLAIHGITARLPNAILEELALFKEPIDLYLVLHTINDKIARAIVHRFTFKKIFRRIVALRKFKQLPCKPPFTVGFKAVRSWNERENRCDHVDLDLSLDESGGTRLISYYTKNGKDEAAHANKIVQNVSQWLGWGRQKSSKDLQQHDQSASTITGVDSDTTLWEVWTS